MLGTQWQKSSRSSANGQCVQVKQVTPSWRKSSRSSGGRQCVEVADGADFVAVRDSKNPNGPVLTFTLPEWEAFIAGVKDNEFDVAAS